MLATAQCDALDGGIRDVARVTERRCALTRQVLPVTALVRFVVAPDGTVLPDVRRKLPGRGLWITGSRAAVAEAARRNVFARGFGREVKVADDLAQETEHQMERAALDALAIAGKAGRVLTGASAVEMALGRDDLRALIHAADAAADGRRKLDAALRRSDSEKSRETPVIAPFSGAQLDLALSRPNVVHAALLAGPGSETFIARTERLLCFRTGCRDRARSKGHASAVGAQDQGCK